MLLYRFYQVKNPLKYDQVRNRFPEVEFFSCFLGRFYDFSHYKGLVKKKRKIYILVEREILYRPGYFDFVLHHCNNYIMLQLQCHMNKMQKEKIKKLAFSNETICISAFSLHIQ